VVKENGSGSRPQSLISDIRGDYRSRESWSPDERKDYIGTVEPIDGLTFVAFSGRKRCGKSTLCQFLASDLHKNKIPSKIVPFAAGPRDNLFTYFRTVDVYSEDKRKEKYDERFNASVRELLVEVGEGMKAILGEAVWVRTLVSRLRSVNFERTGGVVIIPDLRFKVEHDWLVSNKHYLHYHVSGEENTGSVEDEYLTISKNARPKIIKNSREKIRMATLAINLAEEIRQKRLRE